MKVISALLCLFLLTAGGLSQSATTVTDPQDVSVVQKKWSVEVRNPLLDEDPLQAVKDTEQEIRDRREDLRREAVRARLGLPQDQRTVRVKAPETAPASASASYTYEAKFKNNGKKAIQTLIWDYIFFDPETKEEVGRLRFESNISLSPGKTKTVSMRSASPPTGAINAAQAGKKEQYAEQVIIQGIQYADGSVWKSDEIQIN